MEPTYPKTLLEVELANPDQIYDWFMNLPEAETPEEKKIMRAVVNRFQKLD
jgi:hypothetical protein